jgi:hypothetical protein
MKGGKTMLSSNAKQLMLGAASAAILIVVFIRGSRGYSSQEDKYQPRRGVEFLRRSAIK